MANTTNFGWETPDDTDLVKDGASAMRTLGNAIDTSLVDLKGGTTGQVLSKASNTDMDFTWSSVDPLTILDAKGDLISATAADSPARLPVGTNGQYLSANSSTSTGLEWITPPTSGGMTLIQETVANANSSISFSSISSSYKQLLLIWSGIYYSAFGGFSVRFNNNSGADYYEIFGEQYSSSSNVNSGGRTSVADGSLFGSNVTNATLNFRSYGSLLVDNYASTTKHKYYEFHSNFRDNAGATQQRRQGSGQWEETTAITSLDIIITGGTPTIFNSTNTSIRLYGIA